MKGAPALLLAALALAVPAVAPASGDRSGDEERRGRLEQEALRGNAEALEEALDELLFGPSSPLAVDPRRALELYRKAKKANPALGLPDEERVARILEMAAEPKAFDFAAFLEKHGIADVDGAYAVWELAEEASRGGRFGAPDPELVLNLVIRGADVPAELDSALEETYRNWKAGVVAEFDVCDHVTSGYGQGWCAVRAEPAAEEARERRLGAIRERLGAGAGALLDKAYAAAVAFIDAKAGAEEGHGGTGRVAWVLESATEQKDGYLDLVAEVAAGRGPTPGGSLAAADAGLNEAWRAVIEEARRRAADQDSPGGPSPEDLREVQRLWIPYRDATARLLAAAASRDEAAWKAWLTERRTAQLGEIFAEE